MTHGWVIAVPVWGKRCNDLFFGPGLESHLAAIERLREVYRGSVRVRFVIQTDDPARVGAQVAARGFEVMTLPPPAPNAPYLAFVAAHRHAIETARENERIALMNADMVMSIEALAVSEARFRQGKRAIIAAGTRTKAPTKSLWTGRFGPKPMASRELLAWTMMHAHTITKQCFWGEGRCHLPWGVYFRDGDSIVLRGFHLHPFAVVKDRDLPFKNTVDLALVDNYTRDEMHVVTDPDEMALAEMSPPDKVFADNEWPIDATAIFSWALRGAGPTHWWNFGHRICIQGDPSLVEIDMEIAATVERLNPYREVLA